MVKTDGRMGGSFLTTRTRTYATSGWVYFAATVLFVVGAMNIIYGLVLLFNSDHAVLT